MTSVSQPPQLNDVDDAAISGVPDPAVKFRISAVVDSPSSSLIATLALHFGPFALLPFASRGASSSKSTETRLVAFVASEISGTFTPQPIDSVLLPRARRYA